MVLEMLNAMSFLEVITIGHIRIKSSSVRTVVDVVKLLYQHKDQLLHTNIDSLSAPNMMLYNQ
jgi:hypothetical protein